MTKSGSRRRPPASPGRRGQETDLALFAGDGYHRALALIGLDRPGAAWAGDGLFEEEAPSVVADFQVAFDTVHKMRVVPFDVRSLTELVTSSGAPFAPLLFLARLPNQVRTLWEILIGGP